ncbi:MAG: alpha/beta fold hydrolase [Bdellovibrio sp.]|jgi:proline iminopeptidase
MSRLPCSTQMISVPGGQIAVSSVGGGSPVIFLHGGPGDTHDYMRRMAEPLFQDFQCIFFDQRGTGGSVNFERSPELFGLEYLFDDLKAVQEHFQADNAALVGHSWGAMYALYACLRYPDRFKKAALLSMGPLDAGMESATSEHLISVLSDSEKAEWQNLRRERNKARDERSFNRVQALDKELMHLRLKAWIFNPNLREAFLTEYFQDPPPDREVNKLIWEAQHRWFSWEKLSALKTPTWLCVGANDSVPVTQAERIAEIAPSAHVTIYENCGHIPWLEYPEKFYEEIQKFLGAENG